MSKKQLPFEIDAKYDIMSVIKVRHEIPYHSRPFMWNREEHIETVVQGIIDAHHSDSLHWLGFLIVYNNGVGISAITDGQHRVTICFLMILVLAELIGNDEPLQWISQYGTTSILGTTIPKEDQVILDTYGWERFPNIHSVYDYDFEALGNILNRVNPDTKTESGLYNAYEDIKDILVASEIEYRSILRFIHEDIKVTRMTISDWEFAMTAFSSLNNIKVAIPNSFILKNLLTRALGQEHSEEVHSFFNALAKEHGNKSESFIHQIMNMYSQRLMLSDEYDCYLASNPDMPVSAYATFQQTVELVNKYKSLIREDRFGQILMLIVSGHEVESLCLLPLAFIAGLEHFSLIRILIRQLVAYGIRLNRKLSFNPLKMQTPIRALIASGFTGEKTIQETCSEMTRLLNVWLSSEDSVADRISTELYKSRTMFSKARAQLLYIAEATDSHEASLDHTKVHIDHIFAKTRRKNTPTLVDEDNTHRIGNLTPLCGANSAAGMKGNSSLSNKAFSEKVESYGKSNIAMTRALATNTKFLDAQIEERSQKLAFQLAELTATDLGII